MLGQMPTRQGLSRIGGHRGPGSEDDDVPEHCLRVECDVQLGDSLGVSVVKVGSETDERSLRFSPAPPDELQTGALIQNPVLDKRNGRLAADIPPSTNNANIHGLVSFPRSRSRSEPGPLLAWILP